MREVLGHEENAYFRRKIMKSAKKEDEMKIGFKGGIAFCLKYWKRYPWKMLMVLMSVFISIAVDLVYPTYSAKMVDAVARGYAGELGQVNIAFYAVVVLFVLSILHHSVRVAGYYIWSKAICACLDSVIKDALFKVQRLSTDWHANNFGGSTVRKMTRGKWAFDGFGDTLLLELLPAFLIVVGMLIIQTMHWPFMGLVFAIGFAIYIAVSVCFTIKYAAPAHEAFNTSDSHLGGVIADSVTCNAVVKAFGSESREDERFAHESEEWALRVRTSWTRGIDIDQIQSLLMSIMLASIMGLAVWRWAEGIFTPGDVGYTMTSYFIVSGYLRNIGRTIRQLQKTLNEMEDIIRFDRMELDVADKANAKELIVNEGSVVFENVGFTYENQSRALYNDFSLHVKPGEKVALVGHSGSGKSTFVKLVQRLYDVDKGAVLIDGQNVADVTQQSLRQAVSLVPQDPLLFHRTMAENIAYGKPDATMDEIKQAAKLAYADEFIAELMDGYNTMVGERGVKLSGGERQRVAIARAILADKPILIMDEATSSLDSISEHLIQEGMQNLIEGRTTIMIAHRLSTIKEVDRILVFDKGEIVEQGTHKELLNIKDGYYKRLFDMQSFGFIATDEENA